MDISSIMLSIQSLLDNNPLENEPGFSGKSSTKHEHYKEIVEYETFRTLIIRNIFDVPDEFLCFMDAILLHYKSNRTGILENLARKVVSEHNNKIIQLSIYRIHQQLKYDSLQQRLLEMDNLISDKI